MYVYNCFKFIARYIYVTTEVEKWCDHPYCLYEMHMCILKKRVTGSMNYLL